MPARFAGDEGSRPQVPLRQAPQPFLANMMVTLERVLGDLIVDREIVSDSLSLHMSIVGHRTKTHTMKYLTIMGGVFLPPAFIVVFFGRRLRQPAWPARVVHSDALLWAMIVSGSPGPIGMVFWFRRKRCCDRPSGERTGVVL